MLRGPRSAVVRAAVRAIAAVAAVTVATVVAGCGGDDDGDAAGEPVTEQTIVSTAVEFDVTSFAVPAGEEVTVTYENRHERVQHNVHFDVEATDGEEPKTDLAAGPDTQSVTFTIDEPGEHRYVCDLHPAQMRGTLTVVEPAE